MKQWILEWPQIAFDAFFFGYDPRLKIGQRDLPYILRPSQIGMVTELKDCIVDNPHDLLNDKSRDEGGTETIVGMYVIYWALTPQTSFLVGSRKEQYVDAATEIEGNRVSGEHKCLFYKVLYKIATAPVWLRPQPHNLIKSHMKLENLENGSLISGEATNPNFGAGDRRTSILLDEFGRVESKLAASIRDSVSDVSNSVIYNSTHWYGWGHTFGRLRRQQLGKIKVFVLPWFNNPVKIKGLYQSPTTESIEILDFGYYSDLPKKFKVKDYPQLCCVKDARMLPDRLDGPAFVVDGRNKYRSPWYDGEDKRRGPRDLATNIDMNPAMAGDIFFDPEVLLRLRTDYLKPPDITGRFDFAIVKKKIRRVKFIQGNGEFRWWGGLVRRRPDQNSNYLVACDISLGTGASNSVAKVYDLSHYELKGMFLSAKIPPHEFCDYVIAICNWVGGQHQFPFLVWDASGGTGAVFDSRRRALGYNNVYIDTVTRAKHPKRTKKPGFYCTRQAKEDALLELRTALHEGLKQNPAGKYLRIHDELTMNEYDDYIFYDNGDIGLSGNVTDTGGAKKAHGDTVICDAMAVRCFSFAPRGAGSPNRNIYPGTIAWQRAEREKERIKNKRESIWL